MKPIPSTYHKFWPQTIYFLVCPLFYLMFMLVYRPMGLYEFVDMNEGEFFVNVSNSFLIVLSVVFFFRMLFIALKNTRYFNWWIYITWCIGEMAFVTLFLSLYFGSQYNGIQNYFDVLGHCMSLSYGILSYPYIIITVAIRAAQPRKPEGTSSADENTLVRFQDEQKRVKIVVAPSALLYVSAQVNYVNIYYQDGEKVREYTLRNSLKRLEETMVKHGLVRSHRSYFVNPHHVKVLRKESDGTVVALLDVAETKPIPVSKTYYESLSSLL